MMNSHSYELPEGFADHIADELAPAKKPLDVLLREADPDGKIAKRRREKEEERAKKEQEEARKRKRRDDIAARNRITKKTKVEDTMGSRIYKTLREVRGPTTGIAEDSDYE